MSMASDILFSQWLFEKKIFLTPENTNADKTGKISSCSVTVLMTQRVEIFVEMKCYMVCSLVCL